MYSCVSACVGRGGVKALSWELSSKDPRDPKGHLFNLLPRSGVPSLEERLALLGFWEVVGWGRQAEDPLPPPEPLREQAGVFWE